MEGRHAYQQRSTSTSPLHLVDQWEAAGCSRPQQVATDTAAAEPAKLQQTPPRLPPTGTVVLVDDPVLPHGVEAAQESRTDNTDSAASPAQLVRLRELEVQLSLRELEVHELELQLSVATAVSRASEGHAGRVTLQGAADEIYTLHLRIAALVSIVGKLENQLTESRVDSTRTVRALMTMTEEVKRMTALCEKQQHGFELLEGQVSMWGRQCEFVLQQRMEEVGQLEQLSRNELELQLDLEKAELNLSQAHAAASNHQAENLKQHKQLET